jgi:excisionase family DNA binding protein
MTPEPFVTANEIAAHLKLQRRKVLELARRNGIPAYPICFGSRRKTWRFKLSEVEQALACRRSQPLIAAPQPGPSTIVLGSPRSRKEQSHG